MPALAIAPRRAMQNANVVKIAVSAGLWTLLGHGSSQVLRLVSNLLLTRLLAPDLEPPAPAAARVLARACGHETPDALLHACTHARHGVAAEWQRHFGFELEMDDD